MFAREKGATPWPVTPDLAGSFLFERVQGVTRAVHPVSAFCSAVAWLCGLAGVPDPLASDSLFWAFRRGLVASRTTEPVRHAPVVEVSPLLQAALEGDPRQLPLAELRARVVVLLLVVSLARPSDVAQTRRERVVFEEDGSVVLLLPTSKTDRARDGQLLRLRPPEEAGTPDQVEFLRAWLARTEDPSLPQARPLFPGPNPLLPLSSERVSHVASDFARAHGVPAAVTSRSFRPSGTTKLLAAGIPDAQVQALGRWTSSRRMHISYDASVAERVLETLLRPGPRHVSR